MKSVFSFLIQFGLLGLVAGGLWWGLQKGEEQAGSQRPPEIEAEAAARAQAEEDAAPKTAKESGTEPPEKAKPVAATVKPGLS